MPLLRLAPWLLLFGLSCATVATPSQPAAAPVDPSGDWALRWDRGFAGWEPAIFEGALHLERPDAGWAGQLRFKQSSYPFTLDGLTVDGDTVALRFTTPKSKDPLLMQTRFRSNRIIGELRWGPVDWTPVGGRRERTARLLDGAVTHALPRGDVAQSGLDAQALAKLLAEAERQHSTAVVILKDGKVVAEKYRDGYSGEPTVAMSASKSVVNLAVGRLVAEGKLSLQTPISTIFEEWKAGPKAAVTVQQLLSHTSGLDTTRTDFAKETIRAHANATPLVFPPGARFQYNNNAVDLLAALVGRVGGAPLDVALDTQLFSKLDFVEATWAKDNEGTPRGAGELLVRPMDLAKLGQLLLQDGRWNGEQLLAPSWLATSIQPSQSFAEDCGLLWWREGTFARRVTPEVLDWWKEAGVDEATLAKARGLADQSFAEKPDVLAALERTLGAEAFAALKATLAKRDHVPWFATKQAGPVWGYSARGWLGQYLVVYPAARLVAVRMRAPEKADYGGGDEQDGYRRFAHDVHALVPAP